MQSVQLDKLSYLYNHSFPLSAGISSSGVAVFDGFTACSCTVTLHFNFLPAIFAVITAFPAFLALTSPFLFTLATVFLEELHFIFLPLAFITFKKYHFKCSVAVYYSI